MNSRVPIQLKTSEFLRRFLLFLLFLCALIDVFAAFSSNSSTKVSNLRDKTYSKNFFSSQRGPRRPSFGAKKILRIHFFPWNSHKNVQFPSQTIEKTQKRNIIGQRMSLFANAKREMYSKNFLDEARSRKWMFF
jgi:hypothetical protein